MSKQLGYKIRRLRKAKGISIKDLARQVGSSEGSLYAMENPDTRRNFSGRVIRNIAEILGVTVEYLLDDNQDTPSSNTLSSLLLHKFDKLAEQDKTRIIRIINDWTSNNEVMV